MVKIHATSLAVLVLLLGGGLSLPANAQQTFGAPVADEIGWLPPGGSIQVQTYQGIRFASGGIGLSGRDEVRALSLQFNLQLMFAMQGSGNYLAGAQVRILNSHGVVVLDATSEGPYFLAQLPPGNYTVEVSALGQTQRQTARIGQQQSRLSFFWR
ncbi:MAG: carboxypeptidase-like regulatory domain-containing protein [Candidatus Competibacteraceae bacterium]